MTSILKVDTIQNVSTGTTAMTIGTNGVISEPNRPCFCVSSATNQTIPDNAITAISVGPANKAIPTFPNKILFASATN